MFVAGRIPTVVEGRYRLRQRRKPPFRCRQQGHHGRYVAVPEFIRHHYVHLRPYHQHGLVAPLALIAPQRLPLVTLDDGGILIQRGDALVGTTLSQLPHQFPIHLPQSGQRIRLFRNKGDLLRSPPLFGDRDLLLRMKLL